MSHLLTFIAGLFAGGIIVYLYYSTIENKYNAALSKIASYEAAAKAAVKKL